MREDELSKAFLEDRYITQGKNRRQISEETGVSQTRIGTLLQKFGIKRRSITRHGLSSHPLNIMWYGMRERCNNKNADNYKWYGENGIAVCEEWNDFLAFYDWAIRNGWEKGLTIDRIDGSKGYSPDNCRFITMTDQCRNRSTNKSITVNGVSHLQCEWEEILGLPRKTISKWKHRHDVDYVIKEIGERLSRNVD